MHRYLRVLVVCFCLFLTIRAKAAVYNVVFDEKGNLLVNGQLSTPGTFTQFGFTYFLPFNAYNGDLKVFDSGGFGDMLRFIGNNEVAVYSLSQQGDSPDPADVGSIPTPGYAGIVYSTNEISDGGNDYVLWSPSSFQPGYINALNQVTYKFISDGSAVPEPTTLGLLACSSLFVLNRRKR